MGASSRLLLALLAVLLPVAHAQSDAGTTVGQFLLIEPSAAVAAMGNAGATDFSGAMSAYYNPGALGFVQESSAQFTHSPWLAGIDYNYAGVALRLGANTLSLNLTALDSGDMEVRTVEQPLGTGERFSVNDLAFGLGFARRLTDRFSAGVQVKYVQETIWHSQLATAAVDVGVLYQLPFQAYLGASLSNFGTTGSFDGRDLRVRFDQDDDTNGDNSNLPAALETDAFPLPVSFRVGVGYPAQVGENRVHLVVDAFQPSDAAGSLGVGGEWSYANLVFARAGYQRLGADSAEEGGLTLGGGLRYRVAGFGLHFDYAWAGHGMLGSTQRFTLGLGF